MKLDKSLKKLLSKYNKIDDMVIFGKKNNAILKKYDVFRVTGKLEKIRKEHIELAKRLQPRFPWITYVEAGKLNEEEVVKEDEFRNAKDGWTEEPSDFVSVKIAERNTKGLVLRSPLSGKVKVKKFSYDDAKRMFPDIIEDYIEHLAENNPMLSDILLDEESRSLFAKNLLLST